MQIIDNICKRKTHNAHKIEDKSENEYVELKLEIVLKNKLIQNLYSEKTIKEILSENNLPTTHVWQYKLYRLKNKLTPRKVVSKTKPKPKPKPNDKNSTKKKNSDNDLWTCEILPNNNRKIVLNSSNYTTQNVICNYPIDDSDQCSDNYSVSTNENMQSATTYTLSDNEIINNENSNIFMFFIHYLYRMNASILNCLYVTERLYQMNIL